MILLSADFITINSNEGNYISSLLVNKVLKRLYKFLQTKETFSGIPIPQY